MSNKKKKNDFDTRPKAEYWNPELCPACGNNDFIWGRLIEDSFGIYFKKDGDMFKSKPVRARQCTRCGNVMMFAERPD
ncbi:MAG: hypothetical protein AAFR81_04520 [Chloroflexota bacterium]